MYLWTLVGDFFFPAQLTTKKKKDGAQVESGANGSTALAEHEDFLRCMVLIMFVWMVALSRLHYWQVALYSAPWSKFHQAIRRMWVNNRTDVWMRCVRLAPTDTKEYIVLLSVLKRNINDANLRKMDWYRHKICVSPLRHINCNWSNYGHQLIFM